MEVEYDIVKHLLADQDLSALVLNRIFPLQLPQEDKTKYPHGVTPGIVYQRISTPRTLSLDGESSSNPRIQFSVYSEDYVKAKEVARVLNNSLDCYAGKLGDGVTAQVLRAEYRDMQERETGLYRCDVDFFVLNNKKG